MGKTPGHEEWTQARPRDRLEGEEHGGAGGRFLPKTPAGIPSLQQAKCYAWRQPDSCLCVCVCVFFLMPTSGDPALLCRVGPLGPGAQPNQCQASQLVLAAGDCQGGPSGQMSEDIPGHMRWQGLSWPTWTHHSNSCSQTRGHEAAE